MSELQTIHIDQVSFQLKEKHNFDWLQDLGTVFTVFSEQDSGNLSFGVETHGIKKFVKYAGAKTKEFDGHPEDAVGMLKRSVSIYEDLNHKHLIRLCDHFEVGNGYACVFDWFDGECLHSHWSFPPPEKYTHPDSPYFRFTQLPIENRLAAFESILEFHVHVEKQGYVAVDFYDGSILYDFHNDVTKICDIDLYQRKPFINKMGRLWGSSRFMSPEEFELGAAIDERTNVYNMGAIAFGLLGGERDRTLHKWEAGEELFLVVQKAVETDRNDRYDSVEQLYEAWVKVSKDL